MPQKVHLWNFALTCANMMQRECKKIKRFVNVFGKNGISSTDTYACYGIALFVPVQRDEVLNLSNSFYCTNSYCPCCVNSGNLMPVLRLITNITYITYIKAHSTFHVNDRTNNWFASSICVCYGYLRVYWLIWHYSKSTIFYEHSRFVNVIIQTIEELSIYAANTSCPFRKYLSLLNKYI